jgi:hypothetical protein
MRSAIQTNLLVAAVLLAVGCSSAHLPIEGASSSPVAPARFHPVALGTFERPFAVIGERGRIVGRSRAEEPHYRQASLRHRGGFTYVIDFRIVATRLLLKHQGYFPSEARGVRVTYFHPGGVRTAFSDPRTFVSDEAVAAEDISFSIEWGFNQIVLRAITHRTSSRPVAFDGTVVAPPGGRDGSFELYGVYSPVYGGFLLSSTE